jgi:hypothetical protein
VDSGASGNDSDTIIELKIAIIAQNRVKIVVNFDRPSSISIML